MRAVVVREPGALSAARLETLPDPQPASGEAVMEVIAADCNYPDALVIEGRYQVRPPLPFRRVRLRLAASLRSERA